MALPNGAVLKWIAEPSFLSKSIRVTSSAFATVVAINFLSAFTQFFLRESFVNIRSSWFAKAWTFFWLCGFGPEVSTPAPRS